MHDMCNNMDKVVRSLDICVFLVQMCYHIAGIFHEAKSVRNTIYGSYYGNFSWVNFCQVVHYYGYGHTR